MTKPIKVGVRKGAGPPPGYRWSVSYLTVARDEAMGFLNEGQYAHVADLMRTLASEADPTHPVTVSVDAVEGFHELRDKGGILGKINLRIYFVVSQAERVILVLGALKKEADGQTPTWVKTRIGYRLRKFREGEFGSLA